MSIDTSCFPSDRILFNIFLRAFWTRCLRIVFTAVIFSLIFYLQHLFNGDAVVLHPVEEISTLVWYLFEEYFNSVSNRLGMFFPFVLAISDWRRLAFFADSIRIKAFRFLLSSIISV